MNRRKLLIAAAASAATALFGKAQQTLLPFPDPAKSWNIDGPIAYRCGDVRFDVRVRRVDIPQVPEFPGDDFVPAHYQATITCYAPDSRRPAKPITSSNVTQTRVLSAAVRSKYPTNNVFFPANKPDHQALAELTERGEAMIRLRAQALAKGNPLHRLP